MSKRIDKEIRQRIDEYVNGQLSPKEVDELWVQLIQDEEHMDYMKSMANLKGLAQKRRTEKQTSPTTTYLYYAAAAVVALLVAVWGVMEFSMQSVEQSVSPVGSVELQYYRSADGGLTNGTDSEAIQQAITYANENRAGDAVALLKEKLAQTEDYSQQARLNLTLGSLFYNEDQFKDAAEHFSRVINQKEKAELDILTLEKAYWYRGNAYLQMDRQAEARADIKQAYDYNGAYRRVAEQYLEALPENNSQ